MLHHGRQHGSQRLAHDNGAQEGRLRGRRLLFSLLSQFVGDARRNRAGILRPVQQVGIALQGIIAAGRIIAPVHRVDEADAQRVGLEVSLSHCPSL